MQNLTVQRISQTIYRGFAGGGAVGARIRAFDWANSVLGPVEEWPLTLYTHVNLLLNSLEPMCLYWGSQFTTFYNDPCFNLFGVPDSPNRLGISSVELWPELWDTIGPMVHKVVEKQQAQRFDNVLVSVFRNDRHREIYISCLFTPIYDEYQHLIGVLAHYIDLTSTKIAERRQGMLDTLESRLSSATTTYEVCRRSLNTFASLSVDIPFAALYLIDNERHLARLEGSIGLTSKTLICPEQIDFTLSSNSPWPIAQVINTCKLQTLTNLDEHFDLLEVGPWPEPPHTAVVLPLIYTGSNQVSGILIAGVSARRELDDNYYRFFYHSAKQIATALTYITYDKKSTVNSFNPEERQTVLRAINYTAQLQELTIKLTDKLIPTQIADIVLTHVKEALNARFGMIGLLYNNQQTINILKSYGSNDDILAEYQQLSATEIGPFRQVITTGLPLWVNDAREQLKRFPEIPAQIIEIYQSGAVLPLKFQDQVIGILGILFDTPRTFDLTDRRFLINLAQQCAHAIERSRQATATETAISARDELFSMVSHDLKNPLATIKGFAQLLRRRITHIDVPEMERLLDGLQKIDQATDRMTYQIAELLDSSRLQAQQPLEFQLQPVDLIELLNRLILEAKQTTSRHTIVLQHPQGELIGNYDPVRIERVFANLLRNAIKYSPKGGLIKITTERLVIDSQAWASIVFQDQGIGIPAADLPYIFQRFHRAGNVTGQIQGTGIGLSSAFQIVEQHQGTITAKSIESQGATFTVRLPLDLVVPE